MSYIEGIVTDIIFRNEQNGYTVLELDSDGNMEICVGVIPLIQPGEYVRLYGGYVNHKNYGKQFKVTEVETKMPEEDDNIVMFLGSGLIKGVGESTALKIVDRFHDETFSIIENDYEKLAEIKGVSLRLAESIHDQFVQIQSVRSIIMELQKMGLSVKEATNAYEAFGSGASFLIEKNPYCLMDNIRGFGFEKCDKIAYNLGYENYEDIRRQSAVRYILGKRLTDGHTCYPEQTLADEVAKYLGEDRALIETALAQLIKRGYVAENAYNGVRAIALSSAYMAESFIAYKLIELKNSDLQNQISDDNINEVISQNEKLSEEQKQAILSSVNAPVSIITGGPGTGKTTILKDILRIFERAGIVTVLTAPTGRAAKRMEIATQHEAKTIHRLLEYGALPDDEPDQEDYTRFNRDSDNPIEADAVIVDESSMVDIFLMRSLLDAIENGTRVIFTGDFNQLPSVGPGNVLKDILESNIIPSFVLTEVFRSSGNIVMNAHKVNEGEDIELFDTGDFVFIEANTFEEAKNRTIEMFVKSLEQTGSLEETQVICPIKKGAIGVNNLNKELRERVNPRMVEKQEVTYGDVTYREGDKIMQTSNNYNKEWYLKGHSPILTKQTGVYNGDLGIIIEINHDDNTLIIVFDDERVAYYDFDELNQIEHAYAVTVHKSQGSEFDTVILPLCYERNRFLSRNLLYTALTRAKNKLIIIGKQNTIYSMIANTHINRRFTALDHEILKYQKGTNSVMDMHSYFSDEYPYDDLLDIFPEEEE